MKIKEKIISLILVVTTVFSVVAFSPVLARESISDRYRDVYENGYSVPKTKDFMDSFLAFGRLFEKVSGMKIFTEEKIRVTFVDFIKDVYDDVYELSDATMDFELFFKSLPISSAPAKRFYEITKLSREEVVEYLHQKNREADEQDTGWGVFYFFARVYMNLFDDVLIGAIPVGNEEDGIYELFVTVYYIDGTYDEMTPGVYYNAAENYLYGKEGKGVFNLGYDLDADDATLYCVVESWQRNFGFCMFYDVFSYMTPFFDYSTKRMKFDYDGREWMIQIWKGRYIITTGCEIGVYTREKGSKGSYYDCAADEDMLVMNMQLYHGDDLIVSTNDTLHWWLTAFRFTPKCYLPESLKMYATITFKDEEMADLFMASASRYRDMKLYQEENKVSFEW